MNKIVFSLFMVLLLFAVTGTAKTVKYVELGFNQSTLRNENCTPGCGVSGGFGMDYYPFPRFGGFVGSGLKLQNVKISLKDRIWEANLYQMDDYFKKGDININLLFVEIPFQIGITKILNNHTSIGFHYGYCLAIPILNNNKINKLRVIQLEPNEQGEYEYDYKRIEGRIEGFEKQYFGGKVIYKNYVLSFYIEKAIVACQSSTDIKIYDKIDGYLFTIGYNF